MNIEKIPTHILEDLRERLSDEEIKNGTPEYLFSEWCQWNNLGDWGPDLIVALDTLRDCDDSEDAELVSQSESRMNDCIDPIEVAIAFIERD